MTERLSPSLIAAQVLDFLHWPLVILLIMGWAIVPDPIWIAIMGAVVALQAAFMACPLIVLTNSLRRRHDPGFVRQGRSLIALAFRSPAAPRLVGALVAFGVMFGAGKLTQAGVAIAAHL